MANQEQVELLKQGVKQWNKWREQHREMMHPDFVDAHLREIDLRRADLSEADLGHANLSGANFNYANLSGINLVETNLIEAHLSRADLHHANLSGADLSYADLSGANLSHVDLHGAYLRATNLSNAYLNGASLGSAHLIAVNLRGANLATADLSGANLSYADLSEANLQSAILRDTNLSEARLPAADLSEANLHGARLRKANLTYAKLGKADLSEANLGEADLSEAKLRGTNLTEADLSEANLTEADLSEANLTGADFHRANLSRADLSEANVAGADLSGAETLQTVFVKVDLRTVKGLVHLEHRGPSLVQLHTVQLPQDGSALHFLRGVGIPDAWIALYRAEMMYPIQYHSLFISYSNQDALLASRLHADLQAKGVRCWFAPEDMKIGDKLRPRIDEAIHLQDKLLLILSIHAVESDWVEHEVETALAKERQDKRTVLFPVRVDDGILKQANQGWPALIRNERHIGDFTRWTDPQAYQRAFERLLRDLKAEAPTPEDEAQRS